MKFTCDSMLGRLAKWLRFLGYDTLFNPKLSKDKLISLSKKENRVFLTKDKKLLKKIDYFDVYIVKNDDFPNRLREIVQEFDLNIKDNLFILCSECNSKVTKIEKSEIENRIPEKVKLYQEEYWYCNSCDKIYWKGTHYERMKKFLERYGLIE